ncbi:Rid family hydrolase, partial [Burkholderia metallica]
MRDRKAIVPAGMEAVYEKIGYAPGLKVGDTLYVSGQIGRDAAMQLVEGREAQIVQAFENLGLVLEAAGASFNDVVDLTTFHTDM